MKVCHSFWRFHLNNRRRKSDKYLFYEAIDRRLSKLHPFSPTVQKMLRTEGGGYAGELRVDRELSEGRYFSSYLLLRSLLVGSESSYCQIDLLVIHSNFILLIEVKNIPGTLKYDEESHQLTRCRNNEPLESMGDPENQLRRSERFVKNLLARYHMRVPVHGMIVFSNPATILEKPFPNCLAIHVSGLYQALENLHQLHANKSTPHFDSRKIQQLFVLHEPRLPPNRPSHIPHAVYADLAIGVLCPICITNKLIYKSKYWRCSTCKYKSEFAQLNTLQEYRILFSEELTTSEWMKFTGMNSIVTARRMLNESNLGKVGGNKNRKWRINKADLEF